MTGRRRVLLYFTYMKTSYKIALVAAPVAIISFLLSRVIWPDAAGALSPVGIQLPLFIFLAVLESISLGVGVGFLLFGWPILRRAQADKLTLAAFLTSLWFLISWWPHDNMHRVNGMSDLNGLLRIEYLFHFTLLLGGFVIAAYIWRQLRSGIPA
jgi:hypothetical protein